MDVVAGVAAALDLPAHVLLLTGERDLLCAGNYLPDVSHTAHLGNDDDLLDNKELYCVDQQVYELEYDEGRD